MKLFPSLILGLLFFITGCGPQKDPNIDSVSTGSIEISVDESFKPVIEEELTMYKNTYPLTTITARYKTEAECLKDIFYDSATRMVIVTRGLSENEENFFKDSLHYRPSWNLLALDGIAVIVAKGSTDSTFTMAQLADYITGRKRGKKVIFDGLSATSTFRFVLDSLLKGDKPDTTVTQAAPNSIEVMNYVATDTAAIGLVGFSWIGNPEVPEQLEMLKKIKICAIRCEICKGKPFIKPTQISITSRSYPMVRGLYYILRENYSGLGTGLANFMRYERGQLIFRRFYLAPVMEFNIRNVKINIK